MWPSPSRFPKQMRVASPRSLRCSPVPDSSLHSPGNACIGDRKCNMRRENACAILWGCKLESNTAATL